MRAGIDGRALGFVLLGGLAVIACGGGTTATGSPAPTSSPAPTASPTSSSTIAVQTLTPSAATSPTPSASATSSTSPTPLGGGPSGSSSPLALDPCSLLTNDQASAVNGVSYGAGVSHVMGTSGVECVWQSSSPPASVTVQVAQFPSVSEAQIAFAEQRAEQNGFQIEKLTGFADEAVIARAAGGGLSTGGIYVREGATFFDLVYLNGTVPSDDNLKGYAQIILGNLPGS